VSTWIDASQQLPDDETTVLIALDDGEVWTGYHEGDQWFYVSADPLGARVTHWMELPEPPAIKTKAKPSKTVINPAEPWPFPVIGE